MNRQPVHRRVRAEPARRAQQVRERLALLELVNRRTQHGAGDLHPRAVQRHVYHIAGLETHVPAFVAAQQVVVQIERRHDVVQPADLDLAQVGPGSDAAGGVQRSERAPKGADLIGAGLLYLADHVDLVDAHTAHGHVKLDRRARATQLRVHTPQPIEQDAARSLERQVVEVDLTDLRNDDEPLASDVQQVRLVDGTAQHGDEDVARPEAIHRIDRTGELR